MCDHQCDLTETDTLFAIPSGKRLFQLTFNKFSATRSWSFSADEARVAFFDGSTDTVPVYEIATGKLLWKFGVVKSTWPAVALSPSGTKLAVWAHDRGDVWDLRTGNRQSLLTQLTAKRGRDVCVAWSPDNRMLAVGGLDNSVRLWEVSSAQVRREFVGHVAQVRALAFSPDSQFLASGSDDTTLLIWKTLDEKKRRD